MHAWRFVQGWELERITYTQPRADARTLQWSVWFLEGEGSLGYDNLYMVRDGVQSKRELIDTANGT